MAKWSVYTLDGFLCLWRFLDASSHDHKLSFNNLARLSHRKLLLSFVVDKRRLLASIAIYDDQLFCLGHTKLTSQTAVVFTVSTGSTNLVGYVDT